VNPANNWRDGNYGWAAGQSIGWAMFGSAGAGLAVGGAGAAGTVTVGSAASYLGTQAGISAAETVVEGSLAYAMGSDYNWAAEFGKNMFVNTATGGIGAGAKWSGKLAAYAARQGIEIVGDTAIDVGVYGHHLGSSLAWNAVGSIGGEFAFNLTAAGIRRGWRAATNLSAPRGTFDFSQSAGAAKVSEWTNLPGGVRIKQVGNYWIKEVDPDAGRIAQWWGRGSLNAQSRGLTRLGDLAPQHVYQNGKLVVRDVGDFAGTRGEFWQIWWQGSRRLGTPFNDIRRRNIGANGQIFDPSLHPIHECVYWGGTGVIVTGLGIGGYYELQSQ
jgi:hypothetical protein